MIKNQNRYDYNRIHSAYYYLLVIILLLANAIANAAPFVSGLIEDSDTSTIRRPDSYGKPNQSRIWYNSAQNRWDALVPKDDNNGGSSASDHYILKDVVGIQEFTNIELEDRDFGRPDVFWDDNNRQLYVLSSHRERTEFWRLAYDKNTDSYNIIVGASGAGVFVPGILHPYHSIGGNSPATLSVSSNGYIWVSVMVDKQVKTRNGEEEVLIEDGLWVQRSIDGGQNWLSDAVNLNASAKVGVTTWSQFEHNGIAYMGLFAGENGENNQNTSFSFRYIDQTSNDVSVLSNWVNDVAIPQSIGEEQSDDHVSSAVDADSNLYHAVKTESGDDNDPLIKIYKRTPVGVWTQFPVTVTEEIPEESRPSLVIDNENKQLYIFTNGAEIVDRVTPGEREASYVSSPLDALNSLASASFTRIFSEQDKIFTDVITPRHSVDSNSGIVVLAHKRAREDDEGEVIEEGNVWYSKIDLPSSALVTVPNAVGLSQLDAEAAITNANLVLGSISTENSNTVAAGNVISQNPAASQSVASGTAVDLVVSSGPAMVDVPGLVGMTQAAAETSIVSSGLTVGSITLASSGTVATGSVISQNPVAGQSIASGSAVDLVVSSGPALVGVPNLTGMTQSIAETTIISVGLTVGNITTVSSDSVPAGDVISQTPLMGLLVTLGASVELVVSSGPVPLFINLGKAAEFTVLGLAKAKVKMEGSATRVIGNVGIGPKVEQELKKGSITGNLKIDPSAEIKDAGTSVTGSTTFVSFSEPVADALALATTAKNLDYTKKYRDIKRSKTIRATGQLTVVKVRKIELKNGKTLTLVGGADDEFVINIKEMKLESNSKIILQGGLQASHVLFNFIKRDSKVEIKGGSQVSGIFLAAKRDSTIRIEHRGTRVNGKVIAGKEVAIKKSAQIVSF